MNAERNRVCPVELAGSLDSKIRKLFQDPRKILAPYLKSGMTALDVGCGPGFFSIEMAKLVGSSGRVIAADLQQGMLQKLKEKVAGTELEARIEPVECDIDRINVSRTVDFILTFYMVHEVPDKRRLFEELKSILNEGGQLLLVEPKLFHVSRKEFEQTTALAVECGFKAYEGPKLLLSWSAVLKNS